MNILIIMIICTLAYADMVASKSIDEKGPIFELSLDRNRRGLKYGCGCNRMLSPVCSNDGKSFHNPDCAFKCGGAKELVDNYCEDLCPQCLGDDMGAPVCRGDDDMVFKNECVATDCFGIPKSSLRPC